MKKQKRSILIICLLFSMVLSLYGCGNDDSKSKSTTSITESTSMLESDLSEDSAVSEETTVIAEDTETISETASLEETETTEIASETEEQSTTVKQTETEKKTTKKETTTKEQSTTKQQPTTKAPEPTKDPNHSSNVNEKLQWTNAGWAHEVNKTPSGDYVYVTNKKQTIDPVKGNAFSMYISTFTVAEWDVMPLDSYINGNPGTIRWISEDPSIAQVIDNELVGIYEGTTKISGTCGNTTVHITVTVQKGWKSYDMTLNSNLVNLFTGESFQLIASERNVSYASNDSSIAKVSADGIVTGVKAGTTIITATYNGKKRECKVIVANNDGSYMNVSLDTKYTVTKERVLLATDRTFILLDPGVVIEDNLLQNIETILSQIESTTGYSFNNPNAKVKEITPVDRIVIAVSGYGIAFSDPNGVTLAPYDITIQECGAHVLVHELLHTVQHRNTVYCGNALTEGYAEYFGIQIYNNLSFSKSMYDEDYNSWMNLEYSFGDVTFTADNMESYLVNPPDSHPTSYFFVKYLVEKYGADKVQKIQEAITDEFIRRKGWANPGGIVDGFTEQDMFNIIKSMTSANVAKEFYAYFSSFENDMAMNFDMTSYKDVFNQGFTGHATGSFFKLDGGYLTVNGPLVIDFTHALDFANKIYGRKMKGLNVSARIQTITEIISDVSVTYYDAAGNEVPIPEDFDSNYGNIKAVRVKVNMENAGVVRVFINVYNTFDQYFE